MYRKSTITIFCIIYIFFAAAISVHAQRLTPTDTSRNSLNTSITGTEDNSSDITPTPSASVDRLLKIKRLKELVATRVAELKDAVSKPEIMAGIVKEATGSSISIMAKNDQNQVIKLQNDTKILLLSPEEKVQTKKVIMPGQYLLAYGQKSEDSFLATKIFLRPIEEIIIGKVSSVDKEAGQIIIATGRDQTTIDIEKTTKISSYANDGTITKSGFSKLSVGNRVHIVAIPGTQKGVESALRILTLSLDTTLSPTPLASATGTPTIKPTIAITKAASGSAVKRILKSPTPSPKTEE